MSRFLQLIIQLLTNALTVFIGYLINQISSIDSIAKSGSSAKDIQIFWLIGLAVIAIAFINFFTSSSSENQSLSNSSIKGLALASIIPVAFSLALYFGLKSGFLPLQYSREIFYVVLALIAAGALLPSLIMWREAKHKNRQQQTPTISSNILRQKLLKFVSDEVDLRRKNSLHNLVMIDLSMQEQPQQVGQPPRPVIIPDKKLEPIWMLPIQRVLTFFDMSHSKTAIEPTKKIIDVFREVRYKLLILGTPGSGKTTMLLDLAKELCAEARQNENEPIPVIFELSNWKDDKQSIADWLASEMKLKYNLAERITKEWLANHELLPLFDGLDELGLERQVLCVEAINQFIKEKAQRNLVICCRQVEYQKGGAKLNRLHGSVFLKPLNSAQIKDYLKRAGKLSLWSSIEKNQELQRLAKSPLLLSMMVVAYKGRSISSRQELLDAYLDYQFIQPLKKQVYCPGKKLPSQQETVYYLSWLAKRLQAESKTEFLIEKMQPTCLENKSEKWLYGLIIVLICGLAFGLTFGLVGLALGLNLALITGLTFLVFILIFGLMSALNFELVNEIKPIESIKWSFKKIKSRLINGLIIAFIITALMGVLINISGNISGLNYGLSSWLIYAINSWLSYVLTSGLSWRNLEIRKIPNQAIKSSAINCMILFLIAATLTAILSSLTPILVLGRFNGLIPMLTFGLAVGLIFGISIAGIPCIQHLALRLILWRKCSIPWNYALFLDYATELRFLQRVGGRYRFIHDLLREHFADLPLTTK